MPRTEQQERLRLASGSVTSDDPLVVFLYDLMKIHLPAGTVAQLVRDATENRTGTAEFTNGFLARYADFLATELRQKKEG